ncbi:MAG: hypothetical protein JJU00_03385 [Opitutales bacterium]|nr:hypothetical protein [Opitutales bacterium]
MSGAHAFLRTVLRVTLTAVFILSGVLKLAAPDRFLFDLQAFGFIPYPLAYLTAFFLPWLEVVAAGALWSPPFRRGGAAVLAAMTVVFILFIGTAAALGLDADCGCFGDWFVFPNPAAHIAFNTALLAALAYTWWKR